MKKPKFAIDDRPSPKGLGWFWARVMKWRLKLHGWHAILVSELMKKKEL